MKYQFIYNDYNIITSMYSDDIFDEVSTYIIIYKQCLLISKIIILL